MQVSADGGEPALAVRAADGETLGSPQVLPGGKAILFTAASEAASGRWDTAQIVVQSIGGDDRTVVWRGGRDARYVPTGHLIYVQGATLFGIPFDVSSRAVTGSQTPMVEGLRPYGSGALTDSARVRGVRRRTAGLSLWRCASGTWRPGTRRRRARWPGSAARARRRRSGFGPTTTPW